MLNMLHMLDFLGEPRAVIEFLQKIPCYTFSWVLDRFLPKNAPNQEKLNMPPPENPMLNFFLSFRQISPKKCPKPGKC